MLGSFPGTTQKRGNPILESEGAPNEGVWGYDFLAFTWILYQFHLQLENLSDEIFLKMICTRKGE